MAVRKLLILTLALWAGFSNFAYASARIECAVAMSQSAGCCKDKAPCPCSVKAPSSERAIPTEAQTQTGLFRIGTPAVISPVAPPDYFRFEKSLFESPPGRPPLYTLFSVYRI